MADTPPVPRPEPKAKPAPGSRRRTTRPTEPTDTSGNGGNNGSPPPPPRRAADPTPPKRRPSARSLEGRLNEFIGTAAIPFAVAGDEYSAAIIAQRGPALASSLVALADENPAIKRVLNRLLESSAWGGVALAVASIVIPIAQNHRLIPGEDPFSFIYGGAPQRPSGIASPRAGFGGWSQPRPDDGSSMGAPAPSDTPEEPDIPRYFPDAPPGVVTVAAVGAQHPGAV